MVQLQIMIGGEKTAELESLNFDNPIDMVQFFIERLKDGFY